MNTHSVNSGILVRSEHEKWPVSRWTKFLSVTLFAEAVILFFISFMLFFVKRTEGVDPHMVSGAYSGTAQLTFFITVNILAVIIALQGYYLYFFNNEPEIHNDFLRLFFKTAGITSIPIFIIIISGILFFVLG